MISRTIAKRAPWVCAGLLGVMVGAGELRAQAPGFSPEHRRPVEATIHDLSRIEQESPYDRRQRERYDKALQHLHEFGDRLHEGGYFDKDKLNQSINDVQGVIDHNRMSNRAHDVLMRDVTELRELRQHFDDRNRSH
jgi:hypothetical protein